MTGAEPARAGPVSLGVLLAYGLPGLPAAMLGLPLLIYLPVFYAEGLGLGFTAVGLVLLIARLWDGVTDPLVGYLSDRTSGRFGRRRPWLVASLPVTLLAVYFLFLPPAGVGAGYLLAWALIAYLGWTMMTIPHLAWGAELTSDYAGRARVTAARESFAILGTVAAVALPALIGAPATGEGQGGAGEGAALAVIAALTFALLPLAGAILLWVVPEPPPPPLASSAALDWRAGLTLLAANAPFRRLLIGYLLNGVANGLPATLFLLFAAHGLGLPEQAGIFLLVYFLCGIAGIPLWLRLADRLGKHRSWSLAMVWACLAFILVPTLGPGDFWPFLAICVATGLAFGADLALPPAIQADVVDLDTAMGGAQRTGLFFALWGMATKLAFALAVGIAFPLLDWFGFRAGAENDAGARFGLAALYALFPVAFKLAAIALMWRFPLTAARQRELRQAIDARSA